MTLRPTAAIAPAKAKVSCDSGEVTEEPNIETQGESRESPVASEVQRVIGAAILASDGQDEAARLIVESLPEGSPHRVAADAAMRASIRADARRRKLDEHLRAASLKLPEVVVSQAVQDRTRYAAEAREKAAVLEAALVQDPKTPQARNTNRNVRQAIQRHLAAAKRYEREAHDMAQGESEALWVSSAIAETERLAEARGVTYRDFQGAIRSSDHTGLEDAHEKGYLTPDHGPNRADDLLRTGLRYRQAFEIAMGQTTNRGDGGGGFGPKGPQVRVIEASRDLSTMRGVLTPKQRCVLDEVCGQGLGLFLTGRKLHMGMPATRNALRTGLTEAMKAMHERSKSPEAEPDIAGGLKAAGEAIDRAGRGL